jgi:large subunit ribosomal protein L34e
MPQPHLRTRSKKRSKVATPSGRTRTHYKKKIGGTLLCHMCGQPLAGISHLNPVEMRKLNRTKRRIWRLHGGNICHNCLKNALKQAARTI